MALPPGPWTPGIIALLSWMRSPIESFAEGFARWGDVYTIKNPLFGREVVISHPALVKQIFTGDPDVYHAGEANLGVAPVVGPRSVLLLDGAAHHRERKLLMPPFHGERLGVYAEAIRSITERVIDALPAGQEISILPAMQELTFDVILETVFGARERDSASIAALRERLTALVDHAQSPLGMLWMLPMFQRDLGPLTGWARLKRHIAEADASIFEIIAQARAAGSAAEPRSDVLSLLLSARDEAGEPMSDGELRDELITLLLAGHETTAVALAWAIDELGHRPEIVAQIEAELRAAPEGAPAPQPYLDAVIKEVLRLHPIAPMLVRRTAAPVTLRDYEIPPQTYLVICIHNVHHHPEFWPSPAEFQADRFLGKKVDPYAYLPFGGGSRRCIGMAFALLEMRIVLSTWLKKVRFSTPRPPAKTTLRSFLFAPDGGTRVVIEPLRSAAP